MLNSIGFAALVTVINGYAQTAGPVSLAKKSPKIDAKGSKWSQKGHPKPPQINPKGFQNEG